jgi:hypothetical protein
LSPNQSTQLEDGSKIWLGYLPTSRLLLRFDRSAVYLPVRWMQRKDSNLRHQVPKTRVLPLNYSAIILDAPLGLEPRLSGSKPAFLPIRRWGSDIFARQFFLHLLAPNQVCLGCLIFTPLAIF